MNIVTIHDPKWSIETGYAWGFDLWREGFLSAWEKSPEVKPDLLRMLDELRRQVEALVPAVATTPPQTRSEP